jgi:16S rRNA (uracil1498-N3)-methyltransferase
MSRELRRLLMEPERLRAAEAAVAAATAGGQVVELTPPERNYLERVLRYRPGARLAVVDGAGGLWTARLAAEGWLELEQPPSAPWERQPAPQPELLLALGLPKREAELVWRMATELGADQLQPLVAERSVRLGHPPLERWRAVVREASEQCERLWLPALAPPAPAATWLEGALADPTTLGLLATTRRAGLPSLGSVLSGLGEGASRDLPLRRVCLAIGPEGGWSAEEEEAAAAAGWMAVGLGETILRTTTAAVAGLAGMAAWRSERSVG